MDGARSVSATRRSRLLRSAAVVPFLMIAACGGGGVNTMPAPPVAVTPTPTPAPTPTPTPPASAYDTTEYRATVGAVSMNALAAYQRSATGAGIAVGVVDSGLDIASEEFTGRVSAASASVAGSSSYDDEDGHGTAVAFTIAGRRNGAGTHGVAFDATVIVARADTPGSCTTTTDNDDGCSFSDSAIARGIDLAVRSGARVVNLSLGGSAANQTLLDAVNRATAAGVIIVVAAGNDFEKTPATAVNPDAFAQIANSAAARGLVIVAGSVGATDQISSFSNRAGNSAAHYLAAVGERVRAPCNDTQVCLWSGTSFSAPQIAGAVALLAQAFPNLTATQIVSILFSSARDAGAAGSDAVYGGGVLDLTRAFSPLGTSSIAGGGGAISLTGNAMLSAPMGDAAQGPLGAVILDGYSRAFAIDLARSIDRGGPTRSFAGSLQSQTRSYAAAVNDMTVAVTLARVGGGIAVERTLLSPGDAQRPKAIAAIVTRRMGSDAQFAFGFAQNASVLTAQLAGRRDPAFLVARNPDGGQGFDSVVKGSGAFRQRFGAWGVTAAVESGDVLTRRAAGDYRNIDYQYRRSAYGRASVALDRALGSLKLGLSATILDERDTLLGARFGNGLGATRGTSWFLDGAVRHDAGSGWSFGATVRRGWTFADVRGGLSGGGVIRTSGFAGDVVKDGVFGRRDSFGFRVAQPLRVAGGGIDLRLPVDYDYGRNRVSDWMTQRLNLAPAGREIDAELRYILPLFGGEVQTNLFWRRDPGNFAALPDDKGGAVRFGWTF